MLKKIKKNLLTMKQKLLFFLKGSTDSYYVNAFLFSTSDINYIYGIVVFVLCGVIVSHRVNQFLANDSKPVSFYYSKGLFLMKQLSLALFLLYILLYFEAIEILIGDDILDIQNVRYSLRVAISILVVLGILVYYRSILIFILKPEAFGRLCNVKDSDENRILQGYFMLWGFIIGTVFNNFSGLAFWCLSLSCYFIVFRASIFIIEIREAGDYKCFKYEKHQTENFNIKEVLRRENQNLLFNGLCGNNLYSPCQIKRFDRFIGGTEISEGVKGIIKAKVPLEAVLPKVANPLPYYTEGYNLNISTVNQVNYSSSNFRNNRSPGHMKFFAKRIADTQDYLSRHPDKVVCMGYNTQMYVDSQIKFGIQERNQYAVARADLDLQVLNSPDIPFHALENITRTLSINAQFTNLSDIHSSNVNAWEKIRAADKLNRLREDNANKPVAEYSFYNNLELKTWWERTEGTRNTFYRHASGWNGVIGLAVAGTGVVGGSAAYVKNDALAKEKAASEKHKEIVNLLTEQNRVLKDQNKILQENSNNKWTLKFPWFK